MAGWHVMRGEGEGTTLYFGRHQGARFIGLSLRGFSGWTNSPQWMPGGWEFFTPHVHIGRLFMDESRWCERRVLLPSRFVQLWRRIRP